MRKQCPKHIKELLLLGQENKCYYCLISFGEFVVYKRKIVQLIIHYDHLQPHSYLRWNPDNNWVASCQICNQIKKNKLFKTREDAISYVQEKRFGKKLPSLPERIQDKPTEEDILLTKLSVVSMGPKSPKINKDCCEVCGRRYGKGFIKLKWCNPCLDKMVKERRMKNINNLEN